MTFSFLTLREKVYVNLFWVGMTALFNRLHAKNNGIPVIGTAGVLIQAKQNKLIPLVTPLLHEMKSKGYWLSDEFIGVVAAMAGES